ncbi:thioredoxin domain-containing protein [Halopenitus sp. H-Gu1]|uniref:thioredoxin domain-containing protein n=1 Tax=Halopenitus sp. H-Gu1 TaxID=3242697 RepID=UPI00359D794B
MRRSRRTFLSTAGSAAAFGLAGCLGGSGSDVPEYDCDPGSTGESVSELPQPVIGDPDAEIVVASFEDFACPHCARFQTEEFPTIKEEYVDPGAVRYEHWDLPIPVDETWSYGVANAARGVQDRHGSEAFFEFSRVAFEHHEEYSWDVVGYAAEEAGADPCAAIADGESGTYDLVLQSDRNAGVERGVEATPTVFVDGDAVSEPTAEAISDAIDAAR